MSSQNLISGSLPEETKTQVINQLGVIKSQLEFLLSMETGDLQGIFKPGVGYLPFLDLVNIVVEQHPEILPRTFDIAEFKRDYALSKSLAPILLLVTEIYDGLSKTCTVVNSDCMATGFDVYGAVKLNVDKVPGLNAIAEQMAAYFQKGPRKSKPAAAK